MTIKYEGVNKYPEKCYILLNWWKQIYENLSKCKYNVYSLLAYSTWKQGIGAVIIEQKSEQRHFGV